MKSYLHRIAASAIHPVPSIRPALTPVFATLRPEAAPVAGNWPESTVTIAEEPPDRLESPIDRPVAPSPAVVGRQPVHPKSIPYQPLVRSDSLQPLGELQSQHTSVIRTKRNSESLAQIEGVRQSEPHAEPHAEQQSGTRHEARVEAPNRIDLRRTAPAAASSRENTGSLIAPRSDDIQIHIGRIEVTAISAPAPAAIAERVRKTPSLDDYLGRSR